MQRPRGVEVVVLGTAQDGGVPHIGCVCSNCEEARRNIVHRRRVVCLGLVDRPRGRSWIFEATPDIEAQWAVMARYAPECPPAGFFLTHAHLGHYLGLAYLGAEALSANRLFVYCSPRMVAFLRANQPWKRLAMDGHIDPVGIPPGERVALGPDVLVGPMVVPHRDELSDTVAWSIHGPERRLFFCPDTDDWDGWARDVRTTVAEHDIALLDGTFYDRRETKSVGGGAVAHPPVEETLRRLNGVPSIVRFIHINHTNPLLRNGAERRKVEAAGFGVAGFMDRWNLGGS